MVIARSLGVWKQDHEISRDGVPVATWSPEQWRNGAEFTLDGVRYPVRTSGWSTRAELLDPDGRRRRAAWTNSDAAVVVAAAT